MGIIPGHLKTLGGRFSWLASRPEETLERILRKGIGPAPSDLDGWEYDGWNTSSLARWLRIQRFKLGFFRHPPGPVMGCTMRVPPGSLTEPWTILTRGAEPAIMRVFSVTRQIRQADLQDYRNATLLNHRLGKNRFYAERLRSVLVKVDSTDLLVGRVRVSMLTNLVTAGAASLRNALSGYFILKRTRQLPADLKRRVISKYFG